MFEYRRGNRRKVTPQILVYRVRALNIKYNIRISAVSIDVEIVDCVYLRGGTYLLYLNLFENRLIVAE